LIVIILRNQRDEVEEENENVGALTSYKVRNPDHRSPVLQEMYRKSLKAYDNISIGEDSNELNDKIDS